MVTEYILPILLQISEISLVPKKLSLFLQISPQCFLDYGLSLTDCQCTSALFFSEIHRNIFGILDLYFQYCYRPFFPPLIFTVFSLGFCKEEQVSIYVQLLLSNEKLRINILVLGRRMVVLYLTELALESLCLGLDPDSILSMFDIVQTT